MTDWLIKGSFDTPSLAGYRLAGLSALVGLGARSNLAYISAEITNAKGELCNEGEAIYFLMNEEKAKEMGFLHCEVEE